MLGHTASCNTCHDGAGRPPRRPNRRQPILDDTRPANTAGVVLDHTRSSWPAGAGGVATPSRRGPSHALLDDRVSHPLSRREARWPRASTHPLSQGLDSLFRASSMAERLGARHQTSRQTVLDNLWSSRTSSDRTRRPHAVCSWQWRVLDDRRPSSPALGGARGHGVVKVSRCRYWMTGSRRRQSSASKGRVSWREHVSAYPAIWDIATSLSLKKRSMCACDMDLFRLHTGAPGPRCVLSMVISWLS